MKTVLAAAAVAATLLAGSAVTANAAVLVDDGTVTLGATHKAVKGQSTFTDFYTFTLTKAGSFDATITNALSKMSDLITNFTETLTGPSFPKGTSATANEPKKAPGSQFADLSGDLIAGNYTLAVTGTYTAAGASYGGSLSISSVPLPASVALFGVAVVALGAAGAVRRKGVATTAA